MERGRAELGVGGRLANEVGWLVGLHARKRDEKSHGKLCNETLMILTVGTASSYWI